MASLKSNFIVNRFKNVFGDPTKESLGELRGDERFQNLSQE